MRILVTGSAGKVGRVVASDLAGAGHDVVGFDLRRGLDVRRERTVRRAARGCTAIVHLAAIPHDTAGTPAEIMATNVLGTWNVLLSAEEQQLDRVVFFSSFQVFGTVEGQRPPDYLPMDDDHPLRAERPYGLSKRLAEEMCEAFTSRTGISTLCLRPVAVWDERNYSALERSRAGEPTSGCEHRWEDGMFVDVRDVAGATRAALGCPPPGHVRVTLCAADSSASQPTRELAHRLLPEVEWRGGAEFDRDPGKALVDCARAHHALGWRPRYRWADRSAWSARLPSPGIEAQHSRLAPDEL
jgi:UDP-glucose 4-epimerase